MSYAVLAERKHLGHVVRVLGRKATTSEKNYQVARMRHASRRGDDRPPPPPSVAARLRKASGRPATTIEERMAAEAERIHESRRVTPLEDAKSGVPAPPNMHRYAVARRRGLTHAEAVAEARA